MADFEKDTTPVKKSSASASETVTPTGKRDEQLSQLMDAFYTAMHEKDMSVSHAPQGEDLVKIFSDMVKLVTGDTK